MCLAKCQAQSSKLSILRIVFVILLSLILNDGRNYTGDIRRRQKHEAIVANSQTKDKER